MIVQPTTESIEERCARCDVEVALRVHVVDQVSAAIDAGRLAPDALLPVIELDAQRRRWAEIAAVCQVPR